MKKISYLSNKRSMKMPYTESVGTERHNLRRMVADGFKRESKVSPLCSVHPNFKLVAPTS